MYGSLVLIDGNKQPEKGKRVYLGEIKGKNEAWLRDQLLAHPEILPITEIDPAFGPLVPICKELRTEAGPIDAVYVNEHGRLTIMECKLWKNPEARRAVVGQVLDYVKVISKWTYADFQRQVSVAVRQKGNVPFQLVRQHTKSRLREQDFVDAVSRSLRDGRILVLLAGDGIREGVQSLTELVNSAATKAFSVGLIEVAVYQFGRHRLVMQPRVLAQTQLLTRQVTVLNFRGESSTPVEGESEEQGTEQKDTRKHLRSFWEPLLRMRFDDPEQEPPIFIPATNNLSLSTPFPGDRIKAYATVDRKATGVFLSTTRAEAWDTISEFLRRDRRYLVDNLPPGTQVVASGAGSRIGIRSEERFSNEDQRRAWLRETLNDFVNVLRPRLRIWHEQTKGSS